jgi:serine protease Do
MHCLARAFALLAVLVLPVRARGEGRPEVRDAVALQEVFQQIIDKAEPSVGCVLVSRSDDYGRYQAAPSASFPGKLGRFNAGPHLEKIPFDQPERAAAVKALDLSRPEHLPEAFGSCVVIDADNGLVLTSAHVIRRATKIFVRLPGNRGSYADIHAADPRSDLAVLRLLDPPRDLKALKFGDGDKLKKGQWVVSLANPFAAGFRDGSPSASVGIVSNLRRRGPAVRTEYEAARQPLHIFGTLLETDVRINLGSSGGAILNLDGELVGLTTAFSALSSGEAAGGFAVPLDTSMKRIIEVLRRGEEVEYGFLGIQMTRDPLPGTPVHILETIPGGPAAQYGLMRDDYILSIAGRKIHDHDDLLLQIGIGLAGSEVEVEVATGGRTGPRRTVTLRLAKSPVQGSVIACNRPAPRAGLRVDWASIVARQSREIPVGVAIREVISGSPADRARLQAGKVITRVNGKPVKKPADFYSAMKNAGRKVELTVLDFSGHQEETITLEND